MLKVDMGSESVECGFCMEKDEQLVDPRSLPCHHVFCYPCLVGDFEANRIVRCGTCKAVFDVTLARLPSAENRNNRMHFCESCVENKTTEGLAVSYCVNCSRKMCDKHLELHREFFPLHVNLLGIQDYHSKAKMLVDRNCATHQDKPISMGCSTCFQVLCLTCLDCTKECTDGSTHSLLTLESLVKLLKNKRDEIKIQALAKEGELASLFKRSTKVLTDYEKKTKELVNQLHQSRDKQLSELRRMYDELEKELVDNRRTSKQQLVEFIERDIGVRMTEINTLLLLQDAKFKESHQVDIVNSFTSTNNEILRFVDEDLPSLTLTNQKELCVRVKELELELYMVDGAAISIHLPTLLTSFELKKKVPVPSGCFAVTNGAQFTYAGGDGSELYRIDEQDSSVTSLSFPKVEDIDGLCLYNRSLYILIYKRKVVVTDLNGKLITSWEHSDTTSLSVNKLVVTGDKVVVPDRSNKRLTVYSLDGRVIKQIPCLQDGEWRTMALCALDQESVVVSSYATSNVFRVNIETGETIWTFTDVDEPGGVACYEGKYILVTPLHSEQTEIHILQADTGRYLGKLEDSEKRTSSDVSDLCILGDTLIIPRSDEKSVLYYQLM